MFCSIKDNVCLCVYL